MSQYVLVLPDTHVPSQDPLATDIVSQILRSRRFDRVIHLGDFLDCASISYFLKAFPLDQVEEPTVWEEFDQGRALMTEWMEASRTSNWDWIEGNHEHRLRLFERSNPALRGGLSVQANFQQLIGQGLKFHQTWKGATVHGVPLKVGRNVLLLHGRRYSKYHARWMADDFAPWTVVYGHVHDTNSYDRQNFQAPGQTLHSSAYSLGHLANPFQKYIGHYPKNWRQGVGTILVDDDGWGHVTVYPMADGRCVFDGKACDARHRSALVSVPESLRTADVARQLDQGTLQPADVVQRAKELLEPLGWEVASPPPSLEQTSGRSRRVEPSPPPPSSEETT